MRDLRDELAKSAGTASRMALQEIKIALVDYDDGEIDLDRRFVREIRETLVPILRSFVRNSREIGIVYTVTAAKIAAALLKKMSDDIYEQDGGESVDLDRLLDAAEILDENVWGIGYEDLGKEIVSEFKDYTFGAIAYLVGRDAIRGMSKDMRDDLNDQIVSAAELHIQSVLDVANVWDEDLDWLLRQIERRRTAFKKSAMSVVKRLADMFGGDHRPYDVGSVMSEVARDRGDSEPFFRLFGVPV